MTEPESEKNNESNIHQSNEMNKNDMNSSGNTDAHSPKKQYTRSELIDLESNASDQNINVDNVNIFESQLKRENVANIAKTSIEKSAEHGAAQMFDDDFWSKATTNKASGSPNLSPQKPYDDDFQTVLADAMKDTKPFSTTSKVENWLNSRQNPRQYTNANGRTVSVVSEEDQIDTAMNMPPACKSDETDSMVSTQSDKRKHLMYKTQELKHTIRQKLGK